MAIKQVRANRGAPGVDGVRVGELKEHWNKNGKEIMESIRKRKYKPSPMLRVEIPTPDGGVRKLGIPTVTDRLIQ